MSDPIHHTTRFLTHQSKEEDLFICPQGDLGINVFLRPSRCTLSGNGWCSTQLLDELHPSQRSTARHRWRGMDLFEGFVIKKSCSIFW
jgi:hypothetical protein